MRATTRSRRLGLALAATLAVAATACGDGDAETSSFADVPVRTEAAGGETGPATDGTDGDGSDADGSDTDGSDTDGAKNDLDGDAGEDSETTDGPVIDDQREAPAGDAALPPLANPTGDPIVTVEGSADYPQLDLLDLRRDGDVVTLEFAIHGSASRPTPTDVFAAEEDTYYGLLGREDSPGTVNASGADSRRWVSGVTLIDRDSANRHLVLRDSSGTCLCTSFARGPLEEGERYRHSAQFPAPPEGVETMTVEVPQFPSVDNVPIRTVD